MAGVPDERLLSAAAALLERRLADLLRKVTAPTRDDPRGPDVAGGVRIPAALLAVAAAHLVLQEWRERERRGATAASFGASPNGTTWTRGSGIWSHW